MTSRLPPLNPLHVFEVVARTGNLTRASEELHITQSAVSRQLAVLENYLQVRLFQREARGVTLTAVGAAYMRDVAPAFKLLASGTERLRAGISGGPLRVRTYPTFAAKWLMRRLPKFQSMHPEIDVQLATAVPEVDFDKDKADVVIQFGGGNWGKVQADFLFHDEIEPVCSPSLLNRKNTFKSPDHLKGHRILHARYRIADWPDWLAGVGQSGLPASAREMTFASSLLAYQAAIDGVGIAMGQTKLLQQDIDEGKLTRLFNKPLRRDAGYWVLTAADRRTPPKVHAFRQWILDEVRLQEAA